MGMNQGGLRKDYQRAALDPSEVDADPLEQFRRWYDEQKQVTAGEPNAMTVATATTDGRPSARMVLLKHWDANGFVFFSSYNSPKGTDIEENPRAALLFYWAETERQVRIEGTVTPTSLQETEDYFHSRPRGSQIAANIARQSQVVPSRETLELEMAALTEQFEGRDVAIPETWGGFRVYPERVEFWQGRPSRLHDRVQYTREANGWQIVRLAP